MCPAFERHFKYPINLKAPQSFNEKFITRNQSDRRPIYTTPADKVSAREYVSRHAGSRHVVPSLGVYTGFDKMDFFFLTVRFVIKCSHDSSSAARCHSRQYVDISTEKNKLLPSRNHYYIHRAYYCKNIAPKMICGNLLMFIRDGIGM
ncbi:hypothetical protein CBZ97_007025 [Salmonella enterica]|nr:hypothetical protein [Salmonella enterica]